MARPLPEVLNGDRRVSQPQTVLASGFDLVLQPHKLAGQVMQATVLRIWPCSTALLRQQALHEEPVSVLDLQMMRLSCALGKPAAAQHSMACMRAGAHSASLAHASGC